MDLQFEEYWKEFEENELSHSESHYLLSIFSMTERTKSLRAVDLAQELKVSRNAVSLQLKKLSDKGLVEIENYLVQLSARGREVIEKVANKRHLMIVFLSEVLGLPLDIATLDSCKIEHLLSDETGNALLKFMHFLRSDRKVVLNFLKEFQKYYLQCSPEIGCGLCENITKMEDQDGSL
jgi:Mn-dependent DtxR family transcriptional regulator